MGRVREVGGRGDGTRRRARGPRRFIAHRVLLAAAFGVFAVAGPAAVVAQDVTGGVLAECAALSPRLDDIHACLDDYLVVMDERLAEIGTLVDRTLEGEARTAFVLSQRAFTAYRRDNCLWYLAFSTPRTEAEQIAKDCLAAMSLQRLTELQRLLTENGDDAPKSGHYVYGAERNTFRPCGSEARYWVEGDVAVVGELQQSYLELASDDLQVLFARLDGVIDETVTAPGGHSGVFRTNAVRELRVPRDSDCRLPGGTSPLVVAATETVLPPSVSVTDAAPPPPGPAVPEEPAQELLAYFGAWLADCTESAGDRVCALSTSLGGDAAADTIDGGGGEGADEDVRPALSIARRDDEVTRIELVFPDREIDSPTKLRWSIDGIVYGDIVGSTIRVDETAARQVIEASPRVEELLARMIAGVELDVEVLDSVDDERGERYGATLVGVTRALAFADDFVRDGGGL